MELDARRCAIAEVKQRWSVTGWVTKNLLSRGTLIRWSRLHLQSLAPTNPRWARVVVYDPFSLCVIHKEGLCPSSGDINRLMMMIVAVDDIKEFKNISNISNMAMINLPLTSLLSVFGKFDISG
jgi:hypothetical protein